MKKRNIVIFYSESLSSYLLFSEIIDRYHDNIAALIKFPVIPRRQATQMTKRPMLINLLKKSSWSFLFFNIITIVLYRFVALIAGNTLAQCARRHNIPVRTFKTISTDCISAVKEYRPDWIFNNSPNILKKNILSVPQYGTLNYHAAKLPEYRGAGNYFWVMVENESEAAATLHYVDEGLDSGPIIDYSDKIQIKKNMSVFSLWFGLRFLAFPTYNRHMHNLIASKPIPSSPQNNSIAAVRSFPDTYASRLLRKQGRPLITWREFMMMLKIGWTGIIPRQSSDT